MGLRQYSESYKALGAFSRKTIDEKAWAKFWATERKPLGKVKSRKIINTSLIKSLENLPDHSGAVLKYQSFFVDQKDRFETFYLILEKDGSWRILGYETHE